MHHPELAYLSQIVKHSDPKLEYRVLANIGSGTYGDVYKAQRRDDRCLVAIKIMKIDPKDDIRAICQEIHTLMECSHPNIVQYYGSYLRLNKLWICMEFCGGQSMQDIYLYTRIPLVEECIAFVTRETLKGLRHMHTRNRIHRDIKGANILLTEQGGVKIADFGVAAKLSNSAIKRSTVIGTPYWMAPEVASMEHRSTGYDGKCDIWAVGITAIEYAELQPPLFDLDPLMALQFLGARNYKPPNLKERSKWSTRFRTFVKLCLTKNERNRPDASVLLSHDFVANVHLSIQSTRDLLDLKRNLEDREKATFTSSSPFAAIKTTNAEQSSAPPAPTIVEASISQPPPIPHKAQQQSPVHATEQPILPVSVRRDRPLSLVLSFPAALHSHKECDVEEDAFNLLNEPPPQPPRHHNGDKTPCARISSLRRPMDCSLSNHQPAITAAGWPPGDHRLLPDNCLDESNEDLVTEVLDEFEKRQSRLLNAPGDALGNDILGGACRLSFYESEDNGDFDKQPDYLVGSPNRATARWKRRAPLPPPLPPKGEGLKAISPSAVLMTTQKSSFTAPGPINTLKTCDEMTQLCSFDKSTIASVVPPPRPPPPKFDTTKTPSMNYEHSELKRAERQYHMSQGIGLPPTPKVLMGACFMQIFDGCPLKVNATATWMNPVTRAQMIIFGTNDGIYYLNLQEIADAALVLLIPRRCIWLTVFKDTMMSLSGNTPHLYSHNLINAMKAKINQDPSVSGGTLTGRLPTKLLPKRFQPTVKVPNTRGCCMAGVVRNPGNGNKYLCAVLDKWIIVMEWFNPRGTFVEVKRVEVPSMPLPVYNFDLVCNQDQNLPTVCLGVYKTSNPGRYRLHTVDLNADESLATPVFAFLPEDSLPIVKVAHVDYSVLMLCFQDHAKFVDFRGNLCKNRHGISKISFGTNVASVVCLRDGLLAFHPFGLKGFGFDGQLTQDIDNQQLIYQYLGSDKNIVVESRPADDPMSKSNLYLLRGHESSY